MNRRKYLEMAGGTLSVLTLAGCTESNSSDFEEGNSDGGGNNNGENGGGKPNNETTTETATESGGETTTETTTETATETPTKSGGETTDENNSDGSSKDIELLSHQLVREDEGSMAESVKVEGEAKNVSGRELSYAQVEVKFYEGDTLAESSMDNISNWSAGETWAFEVMFLGMGEDAAAITDYKIRAGTSF